MNLLVVLETGVVIFGKEDWLVTGKKHTGTSGGLIICFLIWDGDYVSGSLCEVLSECTLVV